MSHFHSKQVSHWPGRLYKRGGVTAHRSVWMRSREDCRSRTLQFVGRLAADPGHQSRRCCQTEASVAYPRHNCCPDYQRQLRAWNVSVPSLSVTAMLTSMDRPPQGQIQKPQCHETACTETWSGLVTVGLFQERKRKRQPIQLPALYLSQRMGMLEPP